MQNCAQHVAYQLPNEHTRIGYLLEAIQCNDAGLQASITSVKTNTGTDETQNNSEHCASHSLSYDPVAKKKVVSARKRGQANIFNLAASDEFDFRSKKSIDKTGAHFRYHFSEEYKKLTKAQCQELHDYRIRQKNASGKQKDASGHKCDKERETKRSKIEHGKTIVSIIDQRTE